jgi:hypothetical protein
MIRKSGSRFSLATNAERVCAEIMLKQIDAIMMRFLQIASRSSSYPEREWKRLSSSGRRPAAAAIRAHAGKF